jgi:hypothetical protein
MKALYVLPLLALFTACKYDSLNKIIVAADINMVENSDSSKQVCLNKQLAHLNKQIYNLKKGHRLDVLNLMTEKVDTIELEADEAVKISEGVRSTLFQVSGPYENGLYIENAKKVIKGDIETEGTDPKVVAVMDGRTLKLGVQFHNNLSVDKKYYTKSVEAYDTTDTLEVAIRNDKIWNQPTKSADEHECAEAMDLKDLIKIIRDSNK